LGLAALELGRVIDFMNLNPPVDRMVRSSGSP